MTTLLKYEGPGRVLHAFGQEIKRGGEFELPDDLARQLLASPRFNLTVLEPPKPSRRRASKPAEPEAHEGEGQTDEPDGAAADNDDMKEEVA